MSRLKSHPPCARAPPHQRFSISAFPWDAWDGFGTLLGRYFNAKTSVNSGLGRWDGIFSPPVRAHAPQPQPFIHHPASTILRPGTVGITPANPPIGLDRSGLLRHRQPKIRTHPDPSTPKLLFQTRGRQNQKSKIKNPTSVNPASRHLRTPTDACGHQ